MRHFVVRQEGGEYEFMSKRRWQRERHKCPIYGWVQQGAIHCVDSILPKFGLSPFRSERGWIA